jgi:hypothetical protein
MAGAGDLEGPQRGGRPARRRPRRAREAAIALALFALAVWPHRQALDAPFNAVDAIPTVAAARVDGVGELPALLGRELRGGAQTGGSYWRPLTMLTYGVDWLAWGWNAAGYHATDLALAGLAVVAVYAMVRVAFARGAAFAAAVALLFALHPAAIEVVPAVARRQEPLLVIGLALALIGAAGLPRRAALALHLAGCVAAVTSVERGLVVPAVVGSYLILCHPAGGGAALRLRRAVLGALPALAIALAFFALRTRLFGAGGIVFDPASFVRIPPRVALWLLYPQQIVDLGRPETALGAIALAGAAVALAAAAALVLLRTREHALLLFCALWLGSYTLLFTIAGQAHPWYVYTAVPPLMLAAVALAAEALGWLRAGARAPAAAGALLAAALALPSAAVAPLWTPYRAWATVDGLSARFLSELDRVSAETPPETTLVLLAVPGAYRESDGDWLVTQSAAGLWPRSLRVWREVRGIPQPIVALGASELVGAAGAPEVALDGDRLRVAFTSGASRYVNPEGEAAAFPPASRDDRGVTFRWPPGGAAEPLAIFVFDGERLVPVAR